MNFGLIPMSAKPYHIGHHNMIKRASEENDAVIVFASTSDRKRGIAPGLTGHVMVRIWETHIIPLMPRNVEIRLGGNPVRKILEPLDGRLEFSNHLVKEALDIFPSFLPELFL
mgnify:CR=1 FL=1